ncbi:hypothetical protein AOQ84DRAFT_404825 [Glonium stellatum]|uniref:Uncharacterized protein n=1 Tax=Glonium stellatum TaxID=574774 RepID=A0A8E2JU79_9PEZI|nr:hypothetical protein AOQ84DRAFT_404825 [Glonium stellatum]
MASIIAVHGIETSSPKTWTAYEQDMDPKGRSFFWLKDTDMLPSVIKGARTWAFDYNSNYSHDAQRVRIDGLAETLLSCIKDKRDDFESRKIVFIGSCFGGIVIAAALSAAAHETHDEQKKAIFKQTAGVIFLGTPLRGTRTAKFAGWKNLVFGILGNDESSETLLKDLEEDSSRLESLVADFGKLTIRNREQQGMEIRCFYETRTTKVSNAVSRMSPIKLEIILVEKVFACLDCHEHIPLDVRHAMMNKYRGPEDPNFKLVCGRIKDVVEKTRTNLSLTRGQQECMQALSFDYRAQKDINSKRLQKTCEWFLRHEKFSAWRHETMANLLLVTAGPGCGKSVLSRALIDEGLATPGNPDTKTTSICYFFFKDNAEQGSGVNALRAILHQLFRQKPWLIQHAMPDHQAHGPGIPFRELWEILEKSVADANAGPVICVLDALDECKASDRALLIEYISEFYHNLPATKSKLKFLITSRPYYEIETDFRMKGEDLPLIRLDGDEMSEDINKEIDIVIKHEISRIGNCRRPRLDEKTQASLIKHMKEQNNRTYLWVHLMLQEISRSPDSTPRKLEQLLDVIPRSVDDAYEKILTRATNPTQARWILSLILAAERPLTLAEMSLALEILLIKNSGQKCASEDDLELEPQEAFRLKLKSLCGLFVNIVDQKIYLIHQTAKGFLIRKSGSTNPCNPSNWRHTFTPETSHLEALKACVWYLLLDHKDRPTPKEYHRSEPERSQFTKDRALLAYAATSWISHFQQAKDTVDEELAKDALRLCNPDSQKYLLWHPIFKSSFRGPDCELITASCRSLEAVVNLLLMRKSDIEARDEYGWAPLVWTAFGGRGTTVKLLLGGQ